MRRLEVGRVLGPLLIAALMELAVTDARAEGENCPTPKDEIATDRPDVTNSSVVVPVGSFQSENGINTYSRDSGREIDGTNSRWRLGIAQCLEVFVDLPTYFANIKAPGASGWTDVAPAVEVINQNGAREKVNLSVTAGIFASVAPLRLLAVVSSLTCNCRGRGNCMTVGV